MSAAWQLVLIGSCCYIAGAVVALWVSHRRRKQ